MTKEIKTMAERPNWSIYGVIKRTFKPVRRKTLASEGALANEINIFKIS